MKQTWKPGTVLYPVPAVMVSCGTIEKPNIVTVAWTGIVNTEPPMTYISLRPSRHSYDMIMESGEFVINLTNEALTFACDYCGVKSGRDVDKFKECRLTPAPAGKISAPIIAESPVNIECRVREAKPLGTHTMFLADIVNVQVEDDFYDKTGKFHFDRTKPICYSHGEYWSLGQKLGKFGYSIAKKNKKK